MILMIFSLLILYLCIYLCRIHHHLGGVVITQREDILHDWWFLQCLSVFGLIIEFNIRVGINLNLKSDKSHDHFGERGQK